MITLEHARNYVRALEPIFAQCGLHLALTGSTLFVGESSKDIDLVVFPHNSTVNNAMCWLAVCGELERCGWKRTRNVGQMHRYWKSKGLTDRKYVEVWNTPNGIRIDFILMGVM